MTILDVIRVAYTWFRIFEDPKMPEITVEDLLRMPSPEKPRVEYYEYIRSDEWRAIAKAKKESVGWKCEIGGKYHDNRRLEVHHRTYRHLGDEWSHFDELQVLCSRCHNEIHGLV